LLLPFSTVDLAVEMYCRESFKVDSLLAKVEAEIRKQQVNRQVMNMFIMPEGIKNSRKHLAKTEEKKH
jgi:hypothetical protein